MHSSYLFWLFIAIILGLWLVGILRFWRLQSLSRATVNVTALDRLMAIFWLPLYMVTLAILAVSYMFTRRHGASRDE